MANAITVKIDAYTKDFVANIEKASASVVEFSNKTSAQLESARKAFDDFEKKNEALAEGLNKTALVAGVAFAGLTATILASVAAFAEEEVVAQRTAQTIVNTGRAAEITAEQINELTDAYEQTTVFTKEAAQSGINFILTLDKISSDAIPRVSEAALDLAAGVGTDVESAFRALGKALNDPIEGLGALGKAGVKFSNDQEAVIKKLVETGNASTAQNIILQEVEKRFGNLSQTGVDTTKSFEKLRTEFGNLFEDIGKEFAPLLFSLANAFKNLITVIRDNKGLVEFIAILIGAATVVTGIVTGLALAGAAVLKFGAVLAAINVIIGTTVTVFQVLAGATGIGLVLVAIGLLAANWEAVFPRMLAIGVAFFETITKLFSGYQEILAGIFTLDPERIKKGLIAAKDAVLSVGDEYNKELKKQQEQRNEPDVQKAKEAGFTEEESRQIGIAEAQVQGETQRKAAEAARAEQDKQEKLAREQVEREEQLAAEVAYFQQSEQVILDQIRTALGNREAAEIQSDLNVLKNKGDFVAALKKVREAQQKAEENTIFATKKFEDQTQKEKLESLKGTLGTISTLQSSSSAELFAVGKAAALATATIDGIAAVQGAYKVGAGLGGPVVGAALAAAAGAATALNIAKIAAQKPPTGAADGALVTAGQSGVDNQPFMLAKGELVAPERSFDEVVEGVARQRGFVKSGESGAQTGANPSAAPTTQVTISIDQAVGMDAYINELVDKIRDAVEFRGASLGV